MIRILVVDDHSVVRKGIMQIVEDCAGMEVTGEAVNGEGALDLVHSTPSTSRYSTSRCPAGAAWTCCGS